MVDCVIGKIDARREEAEMCQHSTTFIPLGVFMSHKEGNNYNVSAENEGIAIQYHGPSEFFTKLDLLITTNQGKPWRVKPLL